MTLKDYFEIAWKLAIVGLLVYFFFFYMPDRIKQDREYWEHTNFKTDTVYYRISYDSMPRPIFKYVVPPKLVINYIDSTRVEHIHIDMSDSLIKVTDSLKNEITRITTRYLKLYPKAPKLIYGEFQKDSMRLDFLNISGRISTELYPLNYNKFNYQYTETGLRADPLKQPKVNYDWYVFGGFDLAQANALVSTEYSLHRGNYKLQGFTNVYITKEPRLFLGAKLGYRLR